MRVWIVSAEIGLEATSGAPVAAAGALVDCYVPASVIETAIGAARSRLEQDGYEVVDVWRCMRFDIEDWTRDVDPEGVARECAREAQRTNSVVYGPFVYWEAQD